jgi:ankyrin repeat protein
MQRESMWLVLISLLICAHNYAADKEIIKTSQNYSFDRPAAVEIVQELSQLLSPNKYAAEKEIVKTPDKHTFDVPTVVGVMQELCRGYFGLDAEDHPWPEEPMLIVAIEGPLPKTFEILLDIPGQVNKKDSTGFPPLHHAMARLYSGTYTKKSLKLRQNQDKDAQNFVAAGIEKYKKMTQMIIQHPAFDPQQYIEEEVAEKKVEKTYPLDWAATRNCLDFVPLLLQKNSTLYSSIFFKKIAPRIHKVCPELCNLAKNDPRFLKQVMIHSMDEKPDRYYMGATKTNDEQITKSLQFLIKTYQPGQQELDQALYHAFKKTKLADSKFLLESGATCNYFSQKNNETSLLYFANRPFGDPAFFISLVPLIQEKKACDPKKHTDNEGNTPFHYLAKKRQYLNPQGWCKKLLDAFTELGISHSCKNEKGKTARKLHEKRENKMRYSWNQGMTW